MRRSYTGMSVNKAGSVNSIGGTSRSQDGNGVGVAAMEEGERGAGGGWGVGGRGRGAITYSRKQITYAIRTHKVIMLVLFTREDTRAVKHGMTIGSYAVWFLFLILLLLMLFVCFVHRNRVVPTLLSTAY